MWALITCTFNFHCISRGILIAIIRLRCAVLVTTYRVPCSRSVNYPSIPDSFTNKIAAAIKMKCLVLPCNMKHPYFYPIMIIVKKRKAIFIFWLLFLYNMDLTSVFVSHGLTYFIYQYQSWCKIPIGISHVDVNNRFIKCVSPYTLFSNNKCNPSNMCVCSYNTVYWQRVKTEVASPVSRFSHFLEYSDFN